MSTKLGIIFNVGKCKSPVGVKKTLQTNVLSESRVMGTKHATISGHYVKVVWWALPPGEATLLYNSISCAKVSQSTYISLSGEASKRPNRSQNSLYLGPWTYPNDGTLLATLNDVTIEHSPPPIFFFSRLISLISPQYHFYFEFLYLESFNGLIFMYRETNSSGLNE